MSNPRQALFGRVGGRIFGNTRPASLSILRLPGFSVKYAERVDVVRKDKRAPLNSIAHLRHIASRGSGQTAALATYARTFRVREHSQH